MNDHDAAAFGLDGGPHGDGERLWRAVECHADVPTQERKRALADFRSGAANVLVCSDIAARGLDFRFDGDSGGVDMVLQYDLATNAVDYLHRAGRAARLAALAEADGGGDAEAQAGRVVSLVRRQERGRARMLESVVAQGGDVVQAESEVARRIATAPAISRRKNEKMQRRQDRSSQRRGGAARSGGGDDAWRSSSSSSSSSNSSSSSSSNSRSSSNHSESALGGDDDERRSILQQTSNEAAAWRPLEAQRGGGGGGTQHAAAAADASLDWWQKDGFVSPAGRGGGRGRGRSGGRGSGGGRASGQYARFQREQKMRARDASPGYVRRANAQEEQQKQRRRRNGDYGDADSGEGGAGAGRERKNPRWQADEYARDGRMFRAKKRAGGTALPPDGMNRGGEGGAKPLALIQKVPKQRHEPVAAAASAPAEAAVSGEGEGAAKARRPARARRRQLSAKEKEKKVFEKSLQAAPAAQARRQEWPAEYD